MASATQRMVAAQTAFKLKIENATEHTVGCAAVQVSVRPARASGAAQKPIPGYKKTNNKRDTERSENMRAFLLKL